MYILKYLNIKYLYLHIHIYTHLIYIINKYI